MAYLLAILVSIVATFFMSVSISMAMWNRHLDLTMRVDELTHIVQRQEVEIKRLTITNKNSY